jgi:hypothetical protein
MIVGARQTGKTTLAKIVAGDEHPAQYVSLDDIAFLSAAVSDPTGFIAGLRGPVVIDEVQRAPSLFPAIKAAVDHERTPGRFLLTGSANVLLLPNLSESLAGRMEILTLWPLAQAEVEGSSGSWVDTLFSDVLDTVPLRISREDLTARIMAGGYPEPLSRQLEARRKAWFTSYLTTILQRDVRDLANVEGLTALPRLLALLATRAGGLLNTSDISRTTGIPNTTLHRYMSLLQMTYLAYLLPPWSSNFGLRLVKSPKVYLVDTGLAAHLSGITANRLTTQPELLGPLLETFVVMETVKLAQRGVTNPRIYHYRTNAGTEVDILLEAPDGRIVGVEVKASSTVRSSDFRGLRALAEATGDSFHRGIILYTGDEVVPFGERLAAVPVQGLWSGT